MNPVPIKAAYSLFLVLLMTLAIEAQAFQIPGPLIDTQWLMDNQDKVVILDVRKDTQSFIRKRKGSGSVGGMQACGAKTGQSGSVSGHIPNSALVPIAGVAVKQKAGGMELVAMVPSKGDFEKLMQKSGVDQDSAVVITGIGENVGNVISATRLYWTLKYFGHDNVALLDGGVARWAAEKRKIEHGRTKPRKGNWKAKDGRRELLATVDDVMTASQKGNEQLVDIRGPDSYLGLVQFKKVARKGHIPGAKSFPYMLLVHSGGKGTRFYPSNELRKVATAVGIDLQRDAITYCDTGMFGSLGWFALHELLGDQQSRLYVGAMNEWAADPARPVTTFKQE